MANVIKANIKKNAKIKIVQLNKSDDEEENKSYRRVRIKAPRGSKIRIRQT